MLHDRLMKLPKEGAREREKERRGKRGGGEENKYTDNAHGRTTDALTKDLADREQSMQNKQTKRRRPTSDIQYIRNKEMPNTPKKRADETHADAHKVHNTVD